ncbi:MAG: acylphosphatase [Candidatus Woesearchaeota archaeon]
MVHKTYHIIIKGRVHGVGFRNYVAHYALKNNHTGTVQNLPNQTVEIYWSGEESRFPAFLTHVKKGPVLSRVDELHIDEEPFEKFDRFRIL